MGCLNDGLRGAQGYFMPISKVNGCFKDKIEGCFQGFLIRFKKLSLLSVILAN